MYLYKVCISLRAAKANDHKLGGLKQQKCILPLLWSYKSEREVGRLGALWREMCPGLSPSCPALGDALNPSGVV